jgi:hypothetical protein
MLDRDLDAREVENSEWDPADLDALGEEIANFAVRIDVAEHALIHKLRVFDAHGAWARAGFLSCAQWLSWRIGLGRKAAREKVRVARALADLPRIDALFGRGELSYSKVRAITRVATAETEQDFIDVALHATASQLERLTRCYQRCVEIGGTVELPPTGQRRYVRRAETLGGMVKIEMQLAPEEAAVVWDAIEAACDRAQAGEGGGEASAGASGEASAGASGEASAGASEEASVGARGEASAEASAEPSPGAEPTEEQRRADAIVDVAHAYLEHRPRTRGSAYELVLLTSKHQLEHGPGGVGGFLRDGTPVPLAVARMLACDCGHVDVTVGPADDAHVDAGATVPVHAGTTSHHELLDIGRRSRSIPAAIGRALWLRDGGCRVPGCGRRRHLHGHHIRGWAEGGPTKLDNLVLLCPGHHRMVHEGELRITRENHGENHGELLFQTAHGLSLTGAPARPSSGEELEELERFFTEADLHLDPSVNFPRWDGTPLDLAEGMAWLTRAIGAGPAGTT